MQHPAVRLLLIVLGASTFGAAFVSPRVVDAQVPSAVAPSDTIWEIRLSDGSTIFGQITEAGATQLTVRSPAGVVAVIDRSLVQGMAPTRGTLRDGRIWPEDPNRTRLFFGPTGRMLQSGEGYLGAFELFLPFLAYGLTDGVTIAAGTPILPVPELIGRIWYFAPKLGVSVGQQAHLAAGVLAFHNIGADSDNDIATVGIGYLVGSYGNEAFAGTLGVGWGFAGDKVQNRPVFMIGGESRVSPRIKLITENYFVTYRTSRWNPALQNSEEIIRVGSILSGGVRFIGERLSADLGIGSLAGDGDFLPLPIVNFVYNFGVR